MSLIRQIGLLVLAAGLSALIGLEREARHRSAGLRTHMLVGLGSALFAMVGEALGTDPTRVAAQVVSGIGFLGAGAIFRSGDHVRGLTTAAGLWTVAAIGVASGLGLLALAITATGVGLLILHTLAPLADRVGAKSSSGRADQPE
ncbi:MAG: MgtC/SapB family protein [Actinomycetota bacterium]